MKSRWIAVVVAMTAWMLSWGRAAQAQLPISTFAGRQIGDGRQATAASLSGPSGVAFAADGALLIVDRGHDRIRRVDPGTGVISTLVGTVSGDRGNGGPPDQAELKGPLRLRVAANGDLFIAEFGSHTVRKVTAATGLVSRIAGSFDSPGSTGDLGPATAALLNGPADAFPDATGGVLIADLGNHRIRRIDALGNISTVAGTGVPGFAGDGFPAIVAQFNEPSCVLPSAAGGFFVCDRLNHRIRHVAADNTVTTVAGNGVGGFADGPALLAQLNLPSGLAFADGTENVLLIADEGNRRIRSLDRGAGTLSTIAGTGENQFTPDGALALTSPLSVPTALTVAADGRVVFAERGAHRVRQIDTAGNLVTLAGDGVASFGGDDGPKADAQFGQMKSVTRDDDGNFILADSGNNRVRRVNVRTGRVETLAGSGAAAFGGDGGPATDAGLTLSDALVDGAGRLLISDTDNHRIRVVENGVINTLVGTGVPGYTGDGGPASAAQINHPTGITLDAAGNLLIADFENHAIRKVDTAGTITTIAGTGVPGFNGDDIPATAATLNSPTDAEVDAAGNVFIADFENHRIRRVDAASGTITTVAGTGVPGNDGDGGPAVNARLRMPSDMKFDETGALWITDFANHRLRRMTVGGNIDAAAGTGLRGYAGDGGLATDARLLFPLRLLVLSSTQVLVAERDNFVIRLLGDEPVALNSDCTGEGAATCVPGGGKAAADCFSEFKVVATLSGVPRPRLACVDGDASCDVDSSDRQCTFRVGLCLNNEDTRLSCSPGAIRTIKLTGNMSGTAGGQSLITGLGELGPAGPLPKGRGVAFSAAVDGRNLCTDLGDFVVTRPRRNGKGKLGVVVTTNSSGKDKDKLKLVCLAP